jgi:two-component system, NarL family, nitrate/nitrite response regulator NarL
VELGGTHRGVVREQEITRRWAAVRAPATGTIRAMPPESPIGVVADSTPMLCAGISGTLRADGFEVPAETSSAAQVVDLVTRHRAELVVAGTLPDMPVVELVRRLRALPDAPHVVLLLTRVAPDAVAELLSLDVGGLVPRSIDGADLVSAVQRVRRGERVVDPGILMSDAASDDEAAETSTLTAREREVLVLLSEGHSNREIASSLYVSLPTVKTHLAHIYAKLGAKNRNEALGRAVAGGLL